MCIISHGLYLTSNNTVMGELELPVSDNSQQVLLKFSTARHLDSYNFLHYIQVFRTNHSKTL